MQLTTDWTILGSEAGNSKKFLSSQNCPDRLCALPQPPIRWLPGSFPWVQRAGYEVDHLLPRWRTSGTILLLLNTPSRGVKLRLNFTRIIKTKTGHDDRKRAPKLYSRCKCRGQHIQGDSRLVTTEPYSWGTAQSQTSRKADLQDIRTYHHLNNKKQAGLTANKRT